MPKTRRTPHPIPALGVLLGLIAFSAGSIRAQENRFLERAEALQRQVPLIDGHNDYPWQIREKAQLDPAKLEIRKAQPGLQTDIPRLRRGGVGAQFWSVYVPASLAGEAAVRATLEQIDLVHQLDARYADTFELALTADDIERIFKAGKIASLIGMEGGHSIGNSLGALRMFQRLGARYMTLTHSATLAWVDSATDQARHGGLTAFGEAVVREMNWLGMLVDLSHVSPDTMDDALRVSQAPVIFSHSSARALCDVPRNVPDSVLAQVPKNGGLVMVTFVPVFLSPEGPAFMKAEEAEQGRLKALHPNNSSAVENGIRAWLKTHPEPKATLAMVADHIDHLRKIAGIDHIGVGSDFDGSSSTPIGLEDVSKYPALTAELLRRGYSDSDVKKILGLNLLRVLREAEKVSARLQAERPASPALIEQLDGVRK